MSNLLGVFLFLFFFVFSGRVEGEWVAVVPSGAYNYVGAVWVNSTVALAVGASGFLGGVIIRTTNSGLSWTQITTSSADFKGIASRTIGSTSYIIAVDYIGNVALSIDTLGTSWTSVTVDSTTYFYGVTIGSNGVAYICGEFVYSSSTAFTAWTMISSISKMPVYYDIR
jgi:hypothetical protein